MLSGHFGSAVQILLANVVILIGTAIVAVALHRVILFGDRRPGQYFYLAFGRVEWLFFLLPIIAFVAIGIFALIGIALFVLGVMSLGNITLIKGVVSLGIAAITILTTYVFVRFSLLFPIAVVERRYDFGQAWSMTHWNFWRMVGVWIVGLAIPLIILQIIAVAIVYFIFMAGMPVEPNAATSPPGLGTLSPAFSTFAALSRPGPIGLVLNYVMSIIGGALGVGILSYSYKALTGRAPDDVLRE